MKIYIVNQSGLQVDICCGKKEYELGHSDEVAVDVEEDDVIYIDQAIFKSGH